MHELHLSLLLHDILSQASDGSTQACKTHHIIQIFGQLFKKEAELQLQIRPHRPASQNPKRSSSRSSSKDDKRGGAMTSGTLGLLGAKSNDESVMIRHHSSKSTEH